MFKIVIRMDRGLSALKKLTETTKPAYLRIRKSTPSSVGPHGKFSLMHVLQSQQDSSYRDKKVNAPHSSRGAYFINYPAILPPLFGLLRSVTLPQSFCWNEQSEILRDRENI